MHEKSRRIQSIQSRPEITLLKSLATGNQNVSSNQNMIVALPKFNPVIRLTKRRGGKEESHNLVVR